MTAKVAILTATRPDALTIPIQAVVKRKLADDGTEVEGTKAEELDEQDVVYLIEDGEAVVRGVTTGISDDLNVEITDGLDAGDEIIIGPYRTLKKLHAGEAVRAKEVEDENEGDQEDDAEVEIRVD